MTPGSASAASASPRAIVERPRTLRVARHVGVALVRLPVVVHERGVVAGGGLEVDDARQRLVVDLDQRGRLGGDRGRQRGDAGDDVALPADALLREQPPVLDHAAVADVGHVGVREHGEHAGQRARLRRVDPRDPGVRVVGVAELRVDLAGHVEVGGVAPGPRHLLLAVGTDERALPLVLGHRHDVASCWSDWSMEVYTMERAASTARAISRTPARIAGSGSLA